MSDTKKVPVIKLMFFIIDWNKLKVVSKGLEEENVQFYFVSKSKGTASSEILDLLGVGSTEKAMILCLVQDFVVPVLLKRVRDILGTQNAGAGVAFTVSLSAINQPVLHILKEAAYTNIPASAKKEGKTMSSEIMNDLIISVINQGYSDEFMTVARESGARGGTVLSARGLTKQQQVKFFGISVQDEKEIIIILTSREKRTPIMEAVSKAYGITTQADGIIFSLPVDEVMSLNKLEG